MFVEECSELSWEIIVVDDNSPDGTQEVALQLAKVYGEDKIVCSFVSSGDITELNVGNRS